MKKINTKRIMNMAWRMARSAARRFQGKAKEFFAESLRICWAIYLTPFGKSKNPIKDTSKQPVVSDKAKQVLGSNPIRNTTRKAPRVHKIKRFARSQCHVDSLYRFIETRGC